jgi:hypothetical protein
MATATDPTAGLIVLPEVEPSTEPGRPMASSAAAGSGIATWLGIALVVAGTALASAFVVTRARRG